MENVLTSLAYLDAKHDFRNYAQMYKHDISASLPGVVFDIIDEEHALNEAASYAESIEHLQGESPNDLFLSLGGSTTRPIAIVCDAAFCSDLMEQLKSNTIGSVYCVMNREVLNDPGRNKSLQETNRLFIANDIHPKSIRYTRYKTDDIIRYKNAHSLFDIELEYNGKGICCRTIHNGAIIEELEGSSHNEISNALLTIVSTNDVRIRQSAFFRKRAGDWLQVLSCLDMKRQYKINGHTKNLKGSLVYFCSSDRIAVAFALYNDINCILKRDNTYFVYKSKRLNQMSDADSTEFKYRQTHAHLYIPLLKEGIETHKSIKAEWGKQLATISDVTTFDEIKSLVILALHYRTLNNLYASDYTIEQIERFIENPMDPSYDHESISDAIDTFERVMRRYKHLHMYDTSNRETYYKLFTFGNTSLDSIDMLYGGTLMGSLFFARNPVLESFALAAMHKIIELTSYDPNVITLYSLIVETHQTYMHVNQVGGNHPTHSMKIIGDYLTKFLFIQDKPYSLILADDYNVTLNYNRVSIEIIEHLIYNKHITPKNYILYVQYVNSFYEPGEGPQEDMVRFLKGKLKTKTYKRPSRRIQIPATRKMRRSRYTK